MLSNTNINRPAIIEVPEYRVGFDTIYQGMEYLITNKSDHTKQRLIYSMYREKSLDELTTALSLAHKLDIPPITETLTLFTAQWADFFPHEAQDNFLNKTNDLLDKPELINRIL